jgi:putative ABC transport system substrate-binding protein
MRRREFFTLLGCAAIGWPLAGHGQQASKIYRLGYSTARVPYLIEALQAGLHELGYIEGKNFKVEYRFGGPQSERLDAIASELVERRPDVIVTVGTPATFAAKRATTTIPIVMAPVGDPLQVGLVASLAHPGGNITGVSLYAACRSAQGAGASNCAPRHPRQRSKPCHPVLVEGDAIGSSGAGVGGGAIHGAGA